MKPNDREIGARTRDSRFCQSANPGLKGNGIKSTVGCQQVTSKDENI
jgi:hypothetical protein